MSERVPAQPASPAGSRGWRDWRMLTVLTFIYTYGFVDRAILALLVEPIKADLGLTDVQVSLLLGFAFVICYSLVNIPAGHLVDRISRRGIIGWSMVAWSAFTLSCGMAQNFVQMFIARAGVGVSEAAVSPASFSLIRDEIPPERRGRAFSVLGMGPILGSAMSLLLGGVLLHAATAGHFSAIPGFGSVRPWQQVLIVLGGCGIPLAMLALLLPENRGARGDAPAAAATSFAAAFAHLRRNAVPYLLLVGYAISCATLAFGVGAWTPAMLSRQWQTGPGQVGPTLGMIHLLCGPAGLLLGGLAMDRLDRSGRSILLYGLCSTSIAAVASIAMPFMPTLASTYVMVGVAVTFMGVFYAVGANTLSRLTPSGLMGKTTAMYLLPQGIISQSLGPFLIAMLGDTVFRGAGPRSIGHAMAFTAAVVGVIAIALVLALMRVLRTAPGREVESGL